jgi:predicted  nucleic acid-binding Zn-ribbon protein
MAWFVNHYRCGDCGETWDDEWSCMVDDDCPKCGSRHWSPLDSEDVTHVVEKHDSAFIIYESAENADDKPRYFALLETPTLLEANAAIRYRVAALAHLSGREK